MKDFYINIATVSKETVFKTNGALNPAAPLWAGFVGDPEGAAVADSELAALTVSAAGACNGTFASDPRDTGEPAVTDSPGESVSRGKVGIKVAVGVSEGDSTGVAVRCSVGFEVGVSIGVVVGVAVGVTEGGSTRVAVEVSVGVAVKVSIEVVVGVAVRDAVGVSVGEVVRGLVGELVSSITREEQRER